MENRKPIFTKGIERLEKQMNGIQNDDSISAKNKELLSRFATRCTADGLDPTTVRIYLADIEKYACQLGPQKSFLESTQMDVDGFLSKIEMYQYERKVGDKIIKREFSPVTKGHFRSHLKIFYEWLRDYEDFNGKIRIKVNQIRQLRVKSVEELPTQDDTRNLVTAVVNEPRDIVIILIIIEISPRPLELAMLKWKDIKWDPPTALLELRSVKKRHGEIKTRLIRIFHAYPYLKRWKNMHPTGAKDDDYVFVDENGKPLEREGIRSVFRRACERAKITRRMYITIFRHLNVAMAKAGVVGSIPKEDLDTILGWEDLSMMKNYGPLDYKEFDKNYSAKRYGMRKEESNNESEDPIAAKTCPLCETLNGATDNICNNDKCSFTVSKEEQEQKAETDHLTITLNKIAQNPDSLKALSIIADPKKLSYLKEIGFFDDNG